MDIAIIAAHMDDEVLGCGGTIAKYNIEGHNIHVLVLTDSNGKRSHL
jgi:LmbE family N-acetylglucosaminyl deacetylase